MALSLDKSRKIRDRIRDNFDRGAEDYGRFESETAFFSTLLDELLALGPSLQGARVLDVGCGTGASVEGLLQAVGPRGDVVGIDISLGMLREARARVAGRADLAVMDGCRFGGAFRRPFDAVLYNAVLFMLPDARGSLESAREVLVPGGVVLISHLEGAYLPDAGCSVPELLEERGFPVGRHAVSPWPKVLEALGELFDEPAVRPLRVPLSPGRFAAFYGQEPMSAGLLPTLPYPERRRAVEEVASLWQAEGRRIEQIWNLAWARNAPGRVGRKVGRG